MTCFTGFTTDALRTKLESLPDLLFDSWLLQAELVARNARTIRLPKNALLMVDEDGETQLAFLDAESGSTTFAGESLSSNVATSRSLMRRSRIPVPASRTYRSEQVGSMKAFGEARGYPLCLRNATVAYNESSGIMVRNPEEVGPAVKRLKEAHGTGRVIVERMRGSEVLDCLVMGSEVLSVLHNPSGTSPREVVHTVHPELLELAVDALRAHPGIGHGSVTLRADSLTKGISSGRASVVDVSVRSHLRQRVGASASTELIARIVSRHSKYVEVQLSAPKQHVETTVCYEGVVDQAGFRSELELLARGSSEIDMNATTVSSNPSEIRLTASGSPYAIALLSAVGVRGFGRHRRSYLVETSPV